MEENPVESRSLYQSAMEKEKKKTCISGLIQERRGSYTPVVPEDFAGGYIIFLDFILI